MKRVKVDTKLISKIEKHLSDPQKLVVKKIERVNYEFQDIIDALFAKKKREAQ